MSNSDDVLEELNSPTNERDMKIADKIANIKAKLAAGKASLNKINRGRANEVLIAKGRENQYKDAINHIQNNHA